MGQLNLSVVYEGQKQNLVLLAVEGNGPSLYGRNWIKYIHPNWHKIGAVHSSSRLQSILEKYEAVFENELGRIRSHTLQVQPGATPKFFRARQVPFAIRDAVGSELDRLERKAFSQKSLIVSGLPLSLPSQSQMGTSASVETTKLQSIKP